MFTYLTMTSGSREGRSFPLEPGVETLIGRGTECRINVLDPLCSRIHAIVREQEGRWLVRDESRNGTFVNGQKVDEAVLGEGHILRVGNSEFSFHQSEQSPTVVGEFDSAVTQTIVRDARVDGHDSSAGMLTALGQSQEARDLLLLYQLALRMLGSPPQDEVVRDALEMLRERAGASLVGFLWIDDEGKLRPKLVLPENARGEVALSDSLTQLVTKEGRAVWIANQQAAASSSSLQHYADALCVPLMFEGKVLGAVHVYLDHGRFRQSQFDFAISLANIASRALARARQDRSLKESLRQVKAKSGVFDELIGDSKPMKDLKDKIKRVARAGGCVLVRGESGSGKELVARAVHAASPRADRPLLSVNCAAMSETLMESQLFGHKAGAFTGADQDHQGLFQQADLGTLFLDEIGELSLNGQSKLLRILEGHPFLPVGGTEEIRVDVRVIAATNRDLQKFVKDKKFREDLYYRLSVFELHIPPLRDRGTDIELLVDYFLDHFRGQHGRLGLQPSSAARQTLLKYHWPGNVRQLRNVIDSAVVLAGDERIENSDLSLRDTGADEIESLRFDHWERKLIQEALRRTSGSVPEAATLLGIGRATLYRKLEEYGIER